MAAGLTEPFANEVAIMRRALELAERGLGHVEPNPMVGAVVVDGDRKLLGEGWHARFGGPHAEIVALEAAGAAARGGTLFVTLEPCAHQGKTPPCADAVIAAGIDRVVVAVPDPAPHTSGRGIERLRSAGLTVESGLCREEGEALIAPFMKLVRTARPYVHAKWAMTLDGKIASRTGMSRWISSETSRKRVHALRGRMDGIVVGIDTVLADDPLLTPRPPGPRTPVRIVLDRRARLPIEGQLVRTLQEAPVLLATGAERDRERCDALAAVGVEVVSLHPDEMGEKGPVESYSCLARRLLDELGRRGMTNLLVEGGSRVLGSFFDAGLIDEVHCFIAPKLVGGASALSPISGTGLAAIPQLPSLMNPRVEILDGDVYVHGRCAGASPHTSGVPPVGKSR